MSLWVPQSKSRLGLLVIYNNYRNTCSKISSLKQGTPLLDQGRSAFTRSSSLKPLEFLWQALGISRFQLSMLWIAVLYTRNKESYFPNNMVILLFFLWVHHMIHLEQAAQPAPDHSHWCLQDRPAGADRRLVWDGSPTVCRLWRKNVVHPFWTSPSGNRLCLLPLAVLSSFDSISLFFTFYQAFLLKPQNLRKDKLNPVFENVWLTQEWEYNEQKNNKNE